MFKNNSEFYLDISEALTGKTSTCSILLFFNSILRKYVYDEAQGGNLWMGEGGEETSPVPPPPPSLLLAATTPVTRLKAGSDEAETPHWIEQ